jgi:hypothetical protein
MSSVVELPPRALEVTGRDITHRGLRRLSRVLVVLFTVFVGIQVLWILTAAVVTVWFSDHVLVGAKGVFLFTAAPPVWKGTVLYSSQSALTRLAGMIDIVMATLPILLAFWNLRGLFALYSRGIVFARENAAHLKRVGLWLVIYPFAKVLANIIFQAAGGTDKAWFHMELIYALVAGLIVFVIALVMEFGHEIEQEKDSFV